MNKPLHVRPCGTLSVWHCMKDFVGHGQIGHGTLIAIALDAVPAGQSCITKATWMHSYTPPYAQRHYVSLLIRLFSPRPPTYKDLLHYFLHPMTWLSEHEASAIYIKNAWIMPASVVTSELFTPFSPVKFLARPLDIINRTNTHTIILWREVWFCSHKQNHCTGRKMIGLWYLLINRYFL